MSSEPRSAEFTLSHSGAQVALAPVDIEAFDEYTLVGKLGHGGMAEVYLALSTGPNGFRKLLVIKRLHTHMKDDPTLVSMFLDEARLAARLSHPNVVQTNKVGSVAGHHFLAMEYLDGQPLNRILKRSSDGGAPLPLALSARIVSDALDGLHYAHELTDYDGTPLAIVHRDVSPHNLFLTYDGQVKVLDFGIAKAATQESNTRTGTIKGKFAYIAPEQARGERVDARADLWSMGVTMWEALSGRRLFRRSTEVAVLQATLSEPIPYLTEVAPAVPRELADICDRALQRDPERRWPSALAMKSEIDEWIAASSKTASRTTLGAHLKTMFADDIAEQRARIRACLARAEETGRHSILTPSAEFVLSSVTGTPSGVVPVNLDPATRVDRRPTVQGVPAPAPEASGSRRQVALIGGGLVALASVAAMAFWLGTRDASGTSEVPASGLPTAVTTAVELPAPHEPPAIPPSTPRVEAPPTEPTAATETGATETTAAVNPRTTRRPIRRATPTGTAPVEAPVETPTPPPTPSPEIAERGHLHLDSAPYAIVSLEGRRLGITPIDVDLPEGTHTLTLRNPEAGIQTTYRVTVRAGETTSRTIALE